MPPNQPRMNSRSSVERILLRSQWIVTRFIVRQNRNMEQPKLPQSPRATLALDAALEVLGEHGVHGLSHARIDKVAGLPAGSTSNYFRTRQSLLEAAAAHLALREREDFAAPALLLDRVSAENAFVAMLESQSGAFRSRTLARYALFIDLADKPDLAQPLLESRKGFEQWTTATLAALGSSDPLSATAFLMAALDGALLHRICVDSTLEMRPIVARALDSCLGK